MVEALHVIQSALHLQPLLPPPRHPGIRSDFLFLRGRRRRDLAPSSIPEDAGDGVRESGRSSSPAVVAVVVGGSPAHEFMIAQVSR